MKDLEIIIKDLQQELYELQQQHDQALALIYELPCPKEHGFLLH